MTVKSTAVLLAASAAALLVWFVVPESWIARILGTPATLSARRDGNAAGAGASLAAGAEVAATPVPERSLLAAAGVEDAAAAVASSDLPAPGHVAFRVVDAESGRLLEAVRVRLLHAQRFAEYSGGGEVDVCLTSGAWEGNVAAIGYEPARLARFEIPIGVTTELGSIALGRGSGVIEGSVLARHLAADAPVIVQLFGDGRSPCDLCRPHPEAAPPPSDAALDAAATPEECDCGFKADRDEVALSRERRFRFGHLAAGVYWLRAFEPAQRIVASQRIEIARGGTAWREVDLSAPTRARFELRHDSAQRSGLFTGDWASVHHERSAPIHFSFRHEGKVVGEVESRPNSDDVRATMGAPLLMLGAAGPAPGPATWSFGLSFGTGSVGGERLDRARQESDALAFDAAAPEIAGAELSIKRLRADLFEVGPLPRLPLTLVVSCGHYSSQELPLDLRSEPFAPLVVALAPTPEWATKLAEIGKGAPAACVVCHGEFDPATGPKLSLPLLFGDENNNVQGLVNLAAAAGAVEISLRRLEELQATKPAPPAPKPDDH